MLNSKYRIHVYKIAFLTCPENMESVKMKFGNKTMFGKCYDLKC